MSLKSLLKIIILLLLCPMIIWAQPVQAPYQFGAEIPQLIDGEYPIEHFGYSLIYNQEHKQAKWVAYELTAQECFGNYKRTDRFLEDPLVKGGTANKEDYYKSGFDRGHLAPAGDMKWSARAMEESFYYSNMSPQNPSFNRGSWRLLEELVRTWAYQDSSLLIITGPIIAQGAKKIGPQGVSVPQYFFKAVVDNHGDQRKGIAFLMPNQKTHNDFWQYAITIDSLEALLELDLFPKIEDSIELQIESRINARDWSWNSMSFPTNSAKNSNQNKDAAHQCLGKTQAGNRCKNKTTNKNQYCYIHQNQGNPTHEAPPRLKQSVRCTGTTKAVNQCKRKTLLLWLFR